MNTISYPNIFNKNNKNLTTSLSYSIDSINESLKSIFYVNKGELLGDPSYGTRIREKLFNVKTPTLINELKTEIAENINYYIPRIQTSESNIKIFSNPNNTQFKITVGYIIKPNSEFSYYDIIITN